MDKYIPKELLDLIEFDEDDKINFFKYSQVRSKELYYEVAKHLQELINHNNAKIEYGMANDFIRLDKSIKNILFRFLATYEEQVKTILVENYKIENYKFIRKNKFENLFVNEKTYIFLNNWPKNIKQINGSYENLLNYISKQKKFQYFFKNKDLKVINCLRNNVMHHSILLFNKENFQKISILHKSLLEPWKTYLLEQIAESISKRTFLINSQNLKIKEILDGLRII